MLSLASSRGCHLSIQGEAEVCALHAAADGKGAADSPKKNGGESAEFGDETLLMDQDDGSSLMRNRGVGDDAPA